MSGDDLANGTNDNSGLDSESRSDRRGSLVVVGTGIRTLGQLTVETIGCMKSAEALLYVVADPIAEEVIHRLNGDRAESLRGCYKEGEQRILAYEKMIDHILRRVREGKMTVAAFYGHPGVFAYPTHESIRRARAEGYHAVMLPAISAEDCLFADLGVDPGAGGCQSYEATDFMLRSPAFDARSHLILWQIGVLGDWTYSTTRYNTSSMPNLVQLLSRHYPQTHPLIMYEAAVFLGTAPIVARISLPELASYPVSAATTMYVPPIA